MLLQKSFFQVLLLRHWHFTTQRHTWCVVGSSVTIITNVHLIQTVKVWKSVSMWWS